MVAKGEYVGYVDGDDWVADNWLAEVDKVITESHPDIVEYNAFKSTDGKNIEMKTSHFRGFFDEKEVKEKIIPCMLCDKDQRFYTFGVLPAVWSKMIKTEILRDNLCSEDKITFGEDVACIYNSILKCKSFYGIDIPVYYYRQNSQSMTKAYDARRFERLPKFFKALRKLHYKTKIPGFRIWLNELPKNIDSKKVFVVYASDYAREYVKMLREKTNAVIYFWYNNIIETDGMFHDNLKVKNLIPSSFDESDCERFEMYHNTQYYFSMIYVLNSKKMDLRLYVLIKLASHMRWERLRKSHFWERSVLYIIIMHLEDIILHETQYILQKNIKI